VGAWNLKLELIMPISAGLRENFAACIGFIGQQYFYLYHHTTPTLKEHFFVI